MADNLTARTLYSMELERLRTMLLNQSQNTDDRNGTIDISDLETLMPMIQANQHTPNRTYKQWGSGCELVKKILLSFFVRQKSFLSTVFSNIFFVGSVFSTNKEELFV